MKGTPAAEPKPREPVPRPVYISLGSNVEPERHLPMAVEALRRLGILRALSHVYESEAVGPPGQPRFLNLVVRLDTAEEANTLRSRLRALETGLGRVRTSDKFAPRPIDLDLVAIDGIVDPDVGSRGYLAVALAEVAPDLRISEHDETVGARAARLRSAGDLRPRPDVDRALALEFGR